MAAAGTAAAQPLVEDPTLGPVERVGEIDPSLVNGRPVREVVLRTPAGLEDDGTPRYRPLEGRGRQAAINNIRTVPGQPLALAVVENDVRRLTRLGLYGRVEGFVQTYADGTARVIYELVEQPIVQAVEVAGNNRLTGDTIKQQIDVLIGTPVDRFQIDRAIRRIEDLYREKGYALAEVSVNEEELRESGILIFEVREGQQIKITDIRFEGNQALSDDDLRREIDSKEAWLFNRGRIDERVLDTDVGALTAFYRDNGYLDVRVGRQLRPSPNGREAILTFIVEEGPLYTLRDVRVEYVGVPEGTTPPYTAQQLTGLMAIKPGDPFSVQQLRESIQRVSLAVGQIGFIDSDVQRVEQRDTERPLVDLVLVVNLGARYKADEIIIAGNDITRQKVIRREIEQRPDRPLDSRAIEQTEENLERLRLFAPGSVRVTVQPEDPSLPGYRPLLVEVEETNTGELAFGGAVSSDSGLVGRIALTQTNFDITDTPDSMGDFFSGRSFRGGGQTFQIEALPGDRIETYQIALTEPRLLDTEYSLSGRVFYRSRDFDEFDERRVGFRSSLGRRFGQRWRGSLGLRLENIEIGGIADDRPVDVFDVEGQNSLIGVGFSLARNSLDKPFLPTRGTTTAVSVEQVGGDFSFTRLDLSQSIYLPIREDIRGRETVLSLNSRIGWIPQGQDETPTYERFYMGGQSFRGFGFRSVSPKGIRNDTGELGEDPVGGAWSFFLGAEVRQPLFEELIYVVGFIDTGTVTEEPGFDDYRVSAGLGLRLNIPQLSPAPIALDFGFPIVEAEGDERQVFSFSVDVPF